DHKQPSEHGKDDHAENRDYRAVFGVICLGASSRQDAGKAADEDEEEGTNEDNYIDQNEEEERGSVLLENGKDEEKAEQDGRSSGPVQFRSDRREREANCSEEIEEGQRPRLPLDVLATCATAERIVLGIMRVEWRRDSHR
ncbi:hypothetical protein PFISCL1PPCAC_13732, partial [Pristionchus fissidentatus]